MLAFGLSDSNMCALQHIKIWSRLDKYSWRYGHSKFRTPLPGQREYSPKITGYFLGFPWHSVDKRTETLKTLPSHHTWYVRGKDEEADMRRLKRGGKARQVIIFELLHIGTSFLAWIYIFPVSRSSLSIRVTESRSRWSAKKFIYLFLCMLLWAIYKVKVTHEGQSHTWRSRSNQGYFR